MSKLDNLLALGDIFTDKILNTEDDGQRDELIRSFIQEWHIQSYYIKHPEMQSDKLLEGESTMSLDIDRIKRKIRSSIYSEVTIELENMLSEEDIIDGVVNSVNVLKIAEELKEEVEEAIIESIKCDLEFDAESLADNILGN